MLPCRQTRSLLVQISVRIDESSFSFKNNSLETSFLQPDSTARHNPTETTPTRSRRAVSSSTAALAGKVSSTSAPNPRSSTTPSRTCATRRAALPSAAASDPPCHRPTCPLQRSCPSQVPQSYSSHFVQVGCTKMCVSSAKNGDQAQEEKAHNSATHPTKSGLPGTQVGESCSASHFGDVRRRRCC